MTIPFGTRPGILRVISRESEEIPARLRVAPGSLRYARDDGQQHHDEPPVEPLQPERLPVHSVAIAESPASRSARNVEMIRFADVTPDPKPKKAAAPPALPKAEAKTEAGAPKTPAKTPRKKKSG